MKPLALALAVIALPVSADELPWLFATARENAPNLQVAWAELAIAESERLEARSVFDPHLTANASALYGRGELLPIQVRQERSRRELFESVDARFTRLADNLQAELDRQPGPVSVDCEGNSIVINGSEICDPPGAAAERERFSRLAQALARDASDPALVAALQSLQQRNTADNRRAVEGVIRDSRLTAASARQSRADLGDLPNVEIRRQVQADLGWRQRFPSGLEVWPRVAFDGVDSNFEGKPRAPRFGGQGLLPTYRAAVGLTMAWPMGRGGRDALEAPVQAADDQVEARQADRAAAAEVTALAILQAWLALAGSEQRLVLAEARLARAQRLADAATALQRSDVLARLDVEQASARLASEQAARQRALGARESALERVRRTLGVNASVELPSPSPDLARAWSALPVCDGTLGDWRRLADHAAPARSAAAQARRASALVDAARDGTLPRLDVSLTVAWAAREESNVVIDGIVDAFGDTPPGPSVLLTVSGDWSAGNRRALGQLGQALALRERARADQEAQRHQQGRALRLLADAIALDPAETRARQAAAEAQQQAAAAALAAWSHGEGGLLDALASADLADAAALQALAHAEARALRLLELRWRLGGLHPPERPDLDWLAQGSCPGELSSPPSPMAAILSMPPAVRPLGVP